VEGHLSVVAGGGAHASPDGLGRALPGPVSVCSVPVLAGRLALVVLLHHGQGCRSSAPVMETPLLCLVTISISDLASLGAPAMVGNALLHR
jgi:hypothetical protein